MPQPSGRGLSINEAMRVMAHISASEANRQAFEAAPGDVLRSLGIDASAAMGGCDVSSPLSLPSLDQLRQNHDLLTGKFLTAHSSETIHHVVK